MKGLSLLPPNRVRPASPDPESGYAFHRTPIKPGGLSDSSAEPKDDCCTPGNSVRSSVQPNQFRKKLGLVAGETLGKKFAEDTPLLIKNFPQVNEGRVVVWIGLRFRVSLLRKNAVSPNAFRNCLSPPIRPIPAFQLGPDVRLNSSNRQRDSYMSARGASRSLKYRTISSKKARYCPSVMAVLFSASSSRRFSSSA